MTSSVITSVVVEREYTAIYPSFDESVHRDSTISGNVFGLVSSS